MASITLGTRVNGVLERKVGRMSTKARYELNDGPAAHVIWDHAKYAHEAKVCIPVRFRVKAVSGGRIRGKGFTPVLEPQILGVMQEDGSGQSLMIEGYLNGDHFKGHYHARSRSGFIEIQ